MEPLTCVIDANTLVEHIHEITFWIYNGQLRLVVPLSTFERVEQLSRDSKERYLKRLEPPKQKSSSKPARQAHPAFDINPQVAEELLERLKGRNYIRVYAPLAIFQELSEEYSPWKGGELLVEKKASTDNGPTTWAKAAVMNMTSKATLSNHSDDPKSSLKPKLVARAASAEISPWKTNKKAPKISPDEIHPALRPFFSYVLWRLYENVFTRTEKSPSIVVSNDLNVCSMARRLNIPTQTIGELRQVFSAQKVDVDRNFFGDLEQEFSFRDPKFQLKGKKYLTSGVQDVTYENWNDVEVKEEISNEIEVNGTNVETDGHESKSVAAEIEKLSEKATTHPVNGNVHDPKNGSKPVNPEEPIAEEVRGPSSTVAADILAEEPERDVVDEPKLSAAEERSWVVVEDSRHIPEHTNGTKTKQGLDHAKTETYTSINGDPRGDTPGGVTVSNQQQTTPNNTDAQSQQSPTHHNVTEKSTPSFHQSSTSTSPVTAKAEPEIEDSDEEVVVFNPKAKRLSAQQNAAKQFKSRPSNQVDKVRPVSQVQTPVHTPVQTLVQTPVIDPDAFGRSFATNPRPNFTHNGYQSRNSPRGSPRRGQKMNQPEVNYVLKSGSTREASRGQGKLWVP